MDKHLSVGNPAAYETFRMQHMKNKIFEDPYKGPRILYNLSKCALLRGVHGCAYVIEYCMIHFQF